MTPLSGPARPWARAVRLRLRVELLEDRSTPTGLLPVGWGEDVQPVVQAGDPAGTEGSSFSDPDSPARRIDPNSAGSMFGGVGSILVNHRKGQSVGSGSAIGPKHVLTAAHVVDLNGDGKVNSQDGLRGTYFVLNLGRNQSHRIAVSKFTVHPDFAGFSESSVSKDIVVLTLARPLPAGTPIYPLGGPMVEGTQLTLVGYGRSGDGVNGYTTAASPTIKRVGANVADTFHGPGDELYEFDFDGPEGDGPLGGPSLGNLTETQYGTGDSGGPAFMTTGAGAFVLAGLGTYTKGGGVFGALGGGINLFPFRSWLSSVLPPGIGAGWPSASDSSSSGDGGGGTSGGDGGTNPPPPGDGSGGGTGLPGTDGGTTPPPPGGDSGGGGITYVPTPIRGELTTVEVTQAWTDPSWAAPAQDDEESSAILLVDGPVPAEEAAVLTPVVNDWSAADVLLSVEGLFDIGTAAGLTPAEEGDL